MLHKTSIRFKHFMTRRRSDDNNLHDARPRNAKLSIGSPTNISWLSQDPSTNAEQLRRTSSSGTVVSQYLDQTSTAHTSASSLCTCECIEKSALSKESLCRAEAQIQTQSVQPDILYLPTDATEDPSDEAKAWRPIFPDRKSSLSLEPTTQLCTTTPPQTLLRTNPESEILRACHDSTNNDIPPVLDLDSICDIDMQDLSNTVEQLIRETDDAFKAVSSALADAKAATQGWYDTNASKNRAASAPTISRSPSKKERRRSLEQSNPSLIRTPITKARGPPSPKHSNSKAQLPVRERKKSALLGKVFRDVLQQPTNAMLPATNTAVRWTLNDVTTNMVDVFKGKHFRSNVNEMLTSSRIQKLIDDKVEVEAELERRGSADSARSALSFETETDGSDSLGEPFYLEAISLKLDTVKPQPPPPPSLPHFRLEKPQITRRAFGSGTTRPIRPTRFLDSQASVMTAPAEASMTFDTFSFPAPPSPSTKPIPPPHAQPRSARRSSASQKSMKLLPTIPEIAQLNLSPTSNRFSIHKPSSAHSQPSPKLLIPKTERTYRFLPSTSYTEHCPFYTHGPIRLQRTTSCVWTNRKDLTPLSPSPKEEGLDWVAFQMAISGDPNEEYGLANFRSDSIWEVEESELDDLEDWWDSLELNLGTFKRSTQYSRFGSFGKEIASPKTKLEPLNLKEQRGKGGMWKAAEAELIQTWKEEIDTSKITILDELSILPTTTPSPKPTPIPSRSSTPSTTFPTPRPLHPLTNPINSPIPKPPSSPPPPPPPPSETPNPRRPSLADSMPDSPMLDLGRLGQMKEGEVIPMGFNLGHDLEDFLKWETDHVGLFGGLEGESP